MATIDDIYQLLGDVNAITLGRLENKIDAMNATTLGRLEAEIKAIQAALPAAGGGALSPLQAQALADIHDAIMRIETSLKGA